MKLPAPFRKLWPLLFVFAFGCSLIREKPEMNHYRLAPSPAKLPSHPEIELTPVRGAPPFQDTGILYQTSQYRLDAYRFHRWIAPPTEMVQERLGELLDADRGADHAASKPVAVLDTHIKAFQELDEGEETFGLVEIRFCLTSPSARVKTGCWTTLRQSAASHRSPEAAVEAISRSYDEVIAELGTQLRKRASRAPKKRKVRDDL
jgi:uncharacterized lipoprotein YmbA